MMPPALDPSSKFTIAVPPSPTTRLLNSSPPFEAFLPAEPSSPGPTSTSSWYVTLSCSDRNAIGENMGFYIDKAKISAESDFFSDLIDASNRGSPDEESLKLQIAETSLVVGTMLSAIFEPSKEYLSLHASWVHLVDALRLAAKWQARSASAPIFHALLARLQPSSPPKQVFSLSSSSESTPDLTPLLAEAIHQGEGATRLLERNLRAYVAEQGKLEMMPIRLEGRHTLELGADGLSKLSNLVIQLVAEEVLVANVKRQAADVTTRSTKSYPRR